MREAVWSRRRPTGAASVGLLLGLLTLGSTAGSAIAQDDDAFDTRIMREILRGIGLRSSSDPQIDYQERPPLVVPPGRDLPPPQGTSRTTNNPAWPNDPDVRRSRQEAARSKQPYRTAAESEIEDSRVLTPAEMNRGRRRADDFSKRAPSERESAAPLTPNALGYTGNIFRSLWSTVAPAKSEVGQFTQEPPRTSLIDPPVGYQTPSPSQPYGLGKRDVKQKPVDTYTDHPARE